MSFHQFRNRIYSLRWTCRNLAAEKIPVRVRTARARKEEYERRYKETDGEFKAGKRSCRSFSAMQMSCMSRDYIRSSSPSTVIMSASWYAYSVSRVWQRNMTSYYLILNSSRCRRTHAARISYIKIRVAVLSYFRLRRLNLVETTCKFPDFLLGIFFSRRLGEMSRRTNWRPQTVPELAAAHPRHLLLFGYGLENPGRAFGACRPES